MGTPSISGLGLGYGPASTLKLVSKLLIRHATNQLLCAGWPRRRDGNSGCSTELCVLQPVDEPRRLVPGELASGLTLCEPHRAARLAEIGVASVLE